MGLGSINYHTIRFGNKDHWGKRKYIIVLQYWLSNVQPWKHTSTMGVHIRSQKFLARKLKRVLLSGFKRFLQLFCSIHYTAHYCHAFLFMSNADGHNPPPFQRTLCSKKLPYGMGVMGFWEQTSIAIAVVHTTPHHIVIWIDHSSEKMALIEKKVPKK